MFRSLAVALLLGMTLGSAAWAQAITKFDGQYVGELKLTRVIGGDCTQPPPGALYPLTISGGQVRFKYDPRFDTTLRGWIDQNGNFRASQTLRKGIVSMAGHIRQNKVTAHIESPSCNYAFHTRN